MLSARVVVPVLILLVLIRRLGAAAFAPALGVVRPLPILAGLVLGGAAIAAQAARWRVVSRGLGLPVGPGEALTECYRSAALNSVLPGGVAGDVLRAWRQRTRSPRGWRPGAVSVLGERAAGLCVLLVTVAVVLGVVGVWPAAAAAAGAAVVAWAVSRPSLRRLDLGRRLLVWAWSVVALLALLGMATAAAVAIGIHEPPAAVAAMEVVLLGGMAVPVNLGGWGPREAAAALAATLVHVSPAVGVSLAAGYGILSTVSVLPGVLVLVRPRRDDRRRARPAEVELHADVVTGDEATRRSAERVAEPVRSGEPQPGYAVPHEQGSGGHQEPVQSPSGNEAGDGDAATLDEHPAESSRGQGGHHDVGVEAVDTVAPRKWHHLDVRRWRRGDPTVVGNHPQGR